MGLRLQTAKFLLKVSSAIKGLIPLILTPQDLLDANRSFCQRPGEIEFWSKAEWIKRGLNETEEKFLEKYKVDKGRFLVLGSKAGREAIALAKQGLEVVAIDFVDELLEVARRNASTEKVNITFQKQDLNSLTFKNELFDYCMISSFLYSSTPIRKKRIEMLKKIRQILRPEGKFLLTLDFARTHPKKSNFKYTIKKIIAYLVFGNIDYQYGDIALGERDTFTVVHNFWDEQELRDEVEEANFKLEEVNTLLEYAVLSP